MTPEVIAKLEDAFLMGCSDREACLAADIDQATLYRYCEANPKFRDRKEMLKDNPVFQARRVILGALRDNDIQAAQKVMDRKEGSKVAVTGADGGPLQVQEIRCTIVDPQHTSS